MCFLFLSSPITHFHNALKYRRGSHEYCRQQRFIIVNDVVDVDYNIKGWGSLGTCICWFNRIATTSKGVNNLPADFLNISTIWLLFVFRDNLKLYDDILGNNGKLLISHLTPHFNGARRK